VEAGTNVFRLYFSHGNHDGHQARYKIIRDVEQAIGCAAENIHQK
jgi:pyruvate kinase